jgi:hypothetical protein
MMSASAPVAPPRPPRPIFPSSRAVVIVGVLLSSFLLGGCTTLRAEIDAYLAGEPPFPGLVGSRDPASLSEEEIDRRVTFLTERLDATRTHALAWHYGWLTVNTGGAIWSSISASLDDGTDQINNAMEAGKSTIGVIYLLTDPMPGRQGGEPIRALPASTHAEKLAQLEQAERLFRQTVRRSRQRTSWLMHIGNFGLHAVTASVLLGLGAEKDAAMSFLIDSAVGEVQIWTRPWEPVRDWEEYERLVAVGLPEEPRVSWRVVPRGRGLALQIGF